MHIDNLYKSQEILLFKECYAMEKIHGSSSHLSFKDGALSYFAGGEKHETFVKIFDEAAMVGKFNENKYPDMIIYGEAYGGKCQGMKETYGDAMRFIAFEVKIDKNWLCVPAAHEICTKLGLEFVHYVKVAATVDALNAERDADSVQAVRNGIGAGKKREGIVLRPLIELTKNNGERIISKHKRDDFSEVKTPRPVDESKLKIITRANEIADEFVTPMRLQHVLDAFPGAGIEKTGEIIKAMMEDVLREGRGEITDSKEARGAIGKRTAMLFKEHLMASLKSTGE
jgi:hypothetical protein